MLTENKASANSNFGIHRKITANYRGMTDEERNEILKAQKIQQDELNVSDKKVIENFSRSCLVLLYS